MPLNPRASILTTPFDEHGGPDGHEHELIDFSVNSNPFGPPTDLLEYLKKVDIATYPDPTARQARVSAATHHKVAPEQLVFGNGTAELIHRIAAAYLNEGNKVAVFTPTFGEYARACKLYGAEVIKLDASDLVTDKVNFESMQSARLVWLCHPNNPTGQTYSFKILQDLADKCEQQNALLIIDAAYLNLTQLPDKRLPANCLQLHSLTKSFCVAGVRAGYAVAPKAVAQALERVAAPWQASAHAQAVAQWVFTKEAKRFLEQSVGDLLELRSEFQKSIQSLGFEVRETKTNYFLVQVKDATTFKQVAQQAGFRLRNCSSFGLSNYIRLATQLPEQNNLLLNWLTTVKASYA